MQNAEAVLGVLRERGRRGLPLDELYRQLFNPQLYLLAYGRIYSNKGAMTPGVSAETVDGMSLEKIGRIIDAMRYERYRFQPVRRIYIPKKSGKLRPLGLPPWSDKLVGEVIRLLLEAYYEPTFSGRSHGFRPGRGCHTALTEVAHTWAGTAWFIEGDISDCYGSLDHQVMIDTLAERSTTTGSCGCCATCFKPDTWRTGSGTRRSAACRKAEQRPRSCPTSTCTGWTASSRRF
jgi:Reverse transcriptase (RNA-dependent DNA polymerase)